MIMFNKRILTLAAIIFTVLTLTGCGNKPTDNPNFGDAYQAAIEIGQDSNDAQTVDSERNINNIITMMNYQGDESDKTKLKETIKIGINDGKNQGEMDRMIISSSITAGDNLGTGYLLGYTFGCKAVTDNEDECGDNINQQYQQIIMEEIRKQMPGLTQ